ncbi:MAG: DUF1501 domain-containing protein [Planctomycetia bacterium]|nr:DUF1501 domain-containing protein [Planctomycetia bacterium]
MPTRRPPRERCEGATPRRAFLRTGLTGLSAMGLADLLAARATAGAPVSPGSAGPSMIVVWLWGGPSHLETFDPKPGAPAEFRGSFGAIPTNVPGISITEKLPRLARVADKYCLVRSCAHDSPGHVNATHTVITGYPGDLIESAPFTPRYPDVFTVAHKLLPPRRESVPQYIGLPQLRYTGGGHLGPSHGPFSVGADPNAPDFGVPSLMFDDARRARLEGRAGLLDAFDRMRTDVDRSGVMESMDAYRRQATEMLTGPAARRAFDLSAEDPRLRDRYGRDAVGQRCLLARRLVEAGARLVTVDFPCVPGQKAFSWDDHASVWNIFEQMEIRLPVLDRAVSALIEDVFARGLDRETLIVVMGEMGRTPRLSDFKGQPGREHWPGAMSLLMSGGGMPMGQVVGATTAKGEEPRERRLHPGDILATWYTYLGIDPRLSFPDRAGRPIGLLPRGEPIRELI